jgi:HemY protein
MRRVIWIIIVAAIAVAVAWWVAALPGFVSADVNGLTIKTSSPVAVLLLGLLFVALFILVRLVFAVLRTPQRLRAARARRARRQGDEAVTRALVALAAGEPSDARREAQRSRRLLGDTAQTLLLAAEAGRQAQREDEAEAAFRALAEREDAAFLGYRGLLAQAVGREDWTAAAELARRADAAHPGASWLRNERWQLAIRTHAWGDALSLAPSDTPLKATLATAASTAEPDAQAGLKLAKQAFKADPTLAPAALAYAGRLRAAGSAKKAQAVIMQAWAARPHPDLAAFALAPIADKMARHQAAQRLAAQAPADPESSLLLGRTALEAGLTSDARRHAEAARNAVSQRRAWMLLADIAEAEQDPETGRLALRSAAAAGADPSWRCAACGNLYASWHPVCSSCNTPGRIGWTVQPSAPLLATEETAGAIS